MRIEEEKTQHVNRAPWSSPLLDPRSFPRGVQKVIYCFLTCVVVVIVVVVVVVVVDDVVVVVVVFVVAASWPKQRGSLPTTMKKLVTVNESIPLFSFL